MEGDDEARLEGLYPLAPLPAHERVWRHPSEVGHIAWAQSEPPVVIGRRLVGVVGVLGGLLTVTVLWAVFSSHAGTNSSATVTSSRPVKLLNWILPQPSESVAAPVAASVAPRPSTATESPASASAAVNTEQHSFIAVRVGSRGTLALTTAAAIADQHDVVIGLPDGSTSAAHVVFADLHGIAVLRLAHSDGSLTAPGLSIGADARLGASAYVGNDATPLLISEIGDNHFRLSGDAGGCALAGQPVIDDGGRLIGLCAAASDNNVVAVQFVHALQQTMDELGS
ncbi:MAG TPA: hypothetical protein PKV27_11140 [Ilumatobacteraceae bacterium]|nr:hypothetical protein [Ilumatobacteraceae bacterium]